MSKKRSHVWLYFNTEEPTLKFAKCTQCQELINIAGGNTSNWKRHLNSEHSTIIIEENDRSTFVNVTTDLLEPPDKSEIIHSTGTTISAQADSGVSTSRQLPLVFPPSKSQSDIHNYAYSIKPMSITHKKNLHNSLIMAIISELHPFSIIEEPEFKNFI